MQQSVRLLHIFCYIEISVKYFQQAGALVKFLVGLVTGKLSNLVF